MLHDHAYFDVSSDAGVATVRFRSSARPSDASPAEETASVLSELAGNPEVRAVLIVGGDVQFAPAQPSSSPPRDALAGYLVGRRFVESLLEFDKPVVAAVTADALMLGVSIALLSDIVVAEEHVRLRDAHIPLGVPASTAPFIWPALTGLLRAKRYILTGEAICAGEAERAGLVSEVVERGRGEVRGREFADLLASFEPDAITLTKRAFNDVLRRNVDSFHADLAVEHLYKARQRL